MRGKPLLLQAVREDFREGVVVVDDQHRVARASRDRRRLSLRYCGQFAGHGGMVGRERWFCRERTPCRRGTPQRAFPTGKSRAMPGKSNVGPACRAGLRNFAAPPSMSRSASGTYCVVYYGRGVPPMRRIPRSDPVGSDPPIARPRMGRHALCGRKKLLLPGGARVDQGQRPGPIRGQSGGAGDGGARGRHARRQMRPAIISPSTTPGCICTAAASTVDSSSPLPPTSATSWRCFAAAIRNCGIR